MFSNKAKKGGPSRMSSSALSRACESLSANIRFASVDGSARALCVTSAGENEGKSTVCTNLASVMAASGNKVLLVECDMRRRSLARACGVRSQSGLYAVLAGTRPVSQVIVPTPTKGVWLLDCEPSIPNPPDLLSSERFGALIAALRRAYDYVIVDTPPLGAFVDAALASCACDGTVFVVRERTSKREEIRRSLEQLENAGVHVLGLVLTFARSDRENGYYYSYYKDDKGGSRTKSSKPAPSTPAASVAAGDFDSWAKATGIEQLIEHPKARAMGGSGSIGKHSG